MPQTELGVPHAEIRVLAAAVGQREAARQLGISQNTVKSICYRSGDGEKLAQAVEIKADKSLHPNAPNTADALTNTLLERQKQTKLSQSKYLVRASDKLSNVDDERLLDHAPVGKLLSDMASKVWPEQQTAGSAVAVNILISNPPE
jgi:hypothetical protein